MPRKRRVTDTKASAGAKNMPGVLELHDNRFRYIGEGSLDTRKRLALTKVVEMLFSRFGDIRLDKLHFTIHCNSAGEILLVPETTVPLKEAWLRNNTRALKSVMTGLEQAARGELTDLGSFERYANEKID
jgi:hypothetical protein